MRRALPPVHLDRRPHEPAPLIERWVAALELVLDPIGGLLDNLPAHLDPALVPEDMLALVGGWLGLPPDGDLEVRARRQLRERAMEISKLRGTRAGLQLVLDLALPGLALEVRHTGRVTWGADPDGSADAEPPAVEIVCPTAPDADRRAAIERLVLDQLPVGVPYRLTTLDAQAA